MQGERRHVYMANRLVTVVRKCVSYVSCPPRSVLMSVPRASCIFIMFVRGSSRCYDDDEYIVCASGHMCANPMFFSEIFLELKIAADVFARTCNRMLVAGLENEEPAASLSKS